MRLAVDLTCLSEPWAGYQVGTYHFVRALHRAVPGDLELLGFTDTRRRPVPASDGRYRELPGTVGSRVIREQVTVPTAALRFGADRLLVPAYLGPLHAPCPVDLIVWDLLFLRPDSGLSVRQRCYWEGFYRRAFHRSGRLYPCSRTTAREIRRRFPELTDRMGPVLYPGLRDFPRRTVPPDDPPGDPFLLFVGAVSPRKNVDGLLRWYRSAPRRIRRRFDLRIVGHYGWGEPGPNQLHDPSSGIYWHGGISDPARLGWFYDNAHLLVFPSRGEGFGFPTLEAFAHRLPVVLSDIPVFREVAGEAAWYVPPETPEGWDETMVPALEDAMGRRERITRGVRRLRRFSWADSAYRYLQSLPGPGPSVPDGKAF